MNNETEVKETPLFTIASNKGNEYRDTNYSRYDDVTRALAACSYRDGYIDAAREWVSTVARLNMNITSRDAEIAALKDELELIRSDTEYVPYFGWCDVEGCENEGCNGGGCWREGGYWTVCSKHSQEHREGKPQPQMKQSAIDREKTRGADGILAEWHNPTKEIPNGQ